VQCMRGMNSVHRTAVIADDVIMGSGKVVGAFAVILGPARIGDGTWIGPHVVLGTPAEIRGIDHGLAEGGIGVGCHRGRSRPGGCRREPGHGAIVHQRRIIGLIVIFK
jgi:UDP-N-acetylglucosamine acyltransferase